MSDALTPTWIMIILAAIGGVIGGVQTVVKNRKRNNENGIKNSTIMDVTNIIAGVFFAILIGDAFLTTERLLWAPFVGMGAGAVGGYFVDTLVMIAPGWFTNLMPKLLDGMLSHFGYSRKADKDGK